MKNESVTIQHIVKLYVYFFRYLDRRAFHAKLWYAYISVWLAAISSLLFIWVVLYQKFECDLHLLHLKKKGKNEGLIDWFQTLNKQRVSNRFYRWNVNHYRYFYIWLKYRKQIWILTLSIITRSNKYNLRYLNIGHTTL